MTPAEIGRRCAQARKAAGKTQEEVALAVDISRSHLINIEKGKVKKSDALLIEKIASVCGTTAFKLMGSKIPPKEWSAPDLHHKLEALLEPRTEISRTVAMVVNVFYDHYRGQKKLSD